jgi:transposase-like protein
MGKKKTLVTMFEDFHEELSVCPKCKSTNTVKSGIRTLKEDQVQLFLCKSCSKRFSDRKLPHTSYSPKVILTALTYNNQGHTLSMTQ